MTNRSAGTSCNSLRAVDELATSFKLRVVLTLAPFIRWVYPPDTLLA
jgi:hypothetical protein